jgi:hypothetical protein
MTKNGDSRQNKRNQPLDKFKFLLNSSNNNYLKVTVLITKMNYWFTSEEEKENLVVDNRR